jgi:N-acetylmuramoyl-L-alanine amidase
MGPLIVLDAGHGGKDRGCEDSPEDCQEKALTLETVYLVKAYLEKMGYRTFLTRKEDCFVPLDDRVSMANESQAALFVSVHFNAATNKKAKGIEVFYCDSEENVVRKESSKRLAKLLLDKAIACTEATSRGVKTGNLRVIKKTTMPAALIEGGFLTHPEERSRCQDPIYLNALAWGIARGIDDYFKTPCP